MVILLKDCFIQHLLNTFKIRMSDLKNCKKQYRGKVVIHTGLMKM